MIPATHRDHAETEGGSRYKSNRQKTRIWRHTTLEGIEFFQGEYRKYEFARHFHTVPAIGLVDRGRIRMTYRGTCQELSKGNLFLLNPGEVHAPSGMNGQPWGFRALFFDRPALHRGIREIAQGKYHFTQKIVRDDLLERQFSALYGHLESPTTHLAAQTSITTAIESLLDRYSSRQPERPEIRRDQLAISRTRDYIHAHYDRNIPLSELAEAACLSAYHFLRLFRESLGVTPHEYLIQTRIEAAKRLLRRKVSLSGVAARTGFVDQSHFTRYFKRYTGVTPGQYLPTQRLDYQ